MPTESPQPNVSGDPTAGLGRQFWILVPLVGIGAGVGAGLRIHAGTDAARQKWEHVPRISSAARYVELLHTIMRMGRDPAALKVIDERGELIGEIPAERVIQTADAHRPLEIATARDFAVGDRHAE